MKKGLLLLLVALSFSLPAQVAPYSWQDHLGLNSCNSVCRFNGKIYASNRSGIIRFDETDGSVDRLNKINGLHDIGISLLRTNPYNNKLLVIYESSNIDVIDTKNAISNYPDIKLKAINGKKRVNEVFFVNQFAYLATGIGIIVFDTDKLEIKDTYIIGPNGTNLEITQVALNDSLIFAATANGLYKSNFKTKILNDYKSWSLVSSLPAGVYSGVVSVSGNILAAYAPSTIDNAHPPIDTLYALTNNTWSKYFAANAQLQINRLSYVGEGYFSMFAQFGPQVVNFNTKTPSAYITACNDIPLYSNVRDLMYYSVGGFLSYWVADFNIGLFQTYGQNPYFPQNIKGINGFHRNLISNIDVSDGRVAVSPSYPDAGGGSIFTQEGINIYQDNNWTYFHSNDLNNKPILDINCVYFDRKDSTRLWASSWSSGLLEYKNNVLVHVYDTSNTPMTQVYQGVTRCSGLSMDGDGNLWIANSDTKNYITVRKKDGTFASFDFQAPRFTRKIMVDKNNYVWALHEREGGITVFNHNNFSFPQQNVNFRVLLKDVNQGNLESNSVFSIAEDKDGKIWVGTAAGIRVFYNPQAIFTNGNFDAQPIKIVQDNVVELLLETEIVTSIVVDGANNKWCGTQTGGLYCFSPDGLTQIYHFTVDNSPLYSNNIIDLNYNKVTGDVFIGTDFGLQSFRSLILEGTVNCNDMYAYPNPIKPAYTGNVFVRGIMDNSVVKITDESGNLVWETKSMGGQIEWPVKNLSGARVSTGVYIVYAMSTDGEVRCLSKVLVVN